MIFSQVYANEPLNNLIVTAPTPLQFITTREFIAVIAILIFGFLMALLSSFMFRINGLDAKYVVEIISLVLIVSGVLLLVSLGYTSEQIAPSIGLLGTIAGYMLGKSKTGDNQPSSEVNKLQTKGPDGGGSV